MKIYTKIVIDMTSGKVVEEHSFKYHGPLCLLKGGSSSSTSVDEVYNAGMLALSQEQQEWAREMYNMYKTGDVSGTGTGISEMQYNQNLVEANQALLGPRTDVEKAQLSDALAAIGERAPVRSEFYNQALEGVDIGRRMSEAQADVEHGFKLSGESARREAMSYGGLDPTKIASISTGMNLEKAKAIAGARTSAKTLAEDEQFNRLRSAMTL
jgi:hypothetical protein